MSKMGNTSAYIRVPEAEYKKLIYQRAQDVVKISNLSMKLTKVEVENAEHIVKCVNEHDTLVAEVVRLEQIAGGVISNSNGIVTITTNHYEDLRQEVEAYKEKEKICTLCEQHPSWQIRAEKAEAEVERLRKFLKQVDDVACSFPNWWFESNEEYKSFQEKLDELIKDGEC